MTDGVGASSLLQCQTSLSRYQFLPCQWQAIDEVLHRCFGLCTGVPDVAAVQLRLESLRFRLENHGLTNCRAVAPDVTVRLLAVLSPRLIHLADLVVYLSAFPVRTIPTVNGNGSPGDGSRMRCHSSTSSTTRGRQTHRKRPPLKAKTRYKSQR
jgi:hypothetical protein